MKFRYAGREFDVEGVDRDDYIFRFIETTRCFYEVELLEYMRFLRGMERCDEPLFIDAGANIGNHSLYLGALLGGHAISIEPNPRVLPVLRRNLERNVPSHAVYDCAVGAEAGSGRVVVPDSGNAGMARVEVGTNRGDASPDTDAVAITTLDSLLAGHRRERGRSGRVLLLKIDVEGAELDVLRGAPAVLGEERPHVFVEASTPAHGAELMAHLGPLGYEPVTRWGWHATPVVHFAHRPAARLRLAARAWQLAAVPQYVARALVRRARSAKSS